MAEEKKDEKVILERQYIIPLRRRWLKVADYKRGNAAIKEIINFAARHMKTSEDKVKIGRWLNEEIWQRGIKKPLERVFVKASKNEAGVVKVELVNLPKEAKKAEEKAKEMEKKKEKAEKKKEKIEKEKEEKKAEEEAKEREEKKEKAEEKKEKIEKEKEKILLKDGLEHIRKELSDQFRAGQRTEMTAREKAISRSEIHGADKR